MKMLTMSMTTTIVLTIAITLVKQSQNPHYKSLQLSNVCYLRVSVELNAVSSGVARKSFRGEQIQGVWRIVGSRGEAPVRVWGRSPQTLTTLL